jgi:hypothetical protein
MASVAPRHGAHEPAALELAALPMFVILALQAVGVALFTTFITPRHGLQLRRGNAGGRAVYRARRDADRHENMQAVRIATLPPQAFRRPRWRVPDRRRQCRVISAFADYPRCGQFVPGAPVVEDAAMWHHRIDPMRS